MDTTQACSKYTAASVSSMPAFQDFIAVFKGEAAHRWIDKNLYKLLHTNSWAIQQTFKEEAVAKPQKLPILINNTFVSLSCIETKPTPAI